MATLVDAVLLAEFDIDKGSVCRVQYPREVGDKNLLAELMLPEGAHNHFQDWTVFMLGRPPSAADAPDPSASADAALHKRWPVHAYKYDSSDESNGWVLIDRADGAGDGAHNVSLVLGEAAAAADGRRPFILLVDLGGGEFVRIEHHDELQYSTLQPDFASMYTIEGDAVGMHFLSPEDQEDFRLAVEAVAAAAVPLPSMLWCLNHVSNRRDATVRRGAQVKALAICSRFQFIHVWKPLLLLAVDRMYSLSTGLGEYSESPQQQCKSLFDALNALPVSTLPPASELQRQAHRLMLAQGSAQKELTHVGHVSWPPGSHSRIPLRVPLLMQPQVTLSDLPHTFHDPPLTFHDPP